MEQGQEATQPAIQPSVEDSALEIARGILQQEEGPQERPRDDKGKFTKKEGPEPTQSAEAQEEPQAEEAPAEEAPEEIDWDKIKSYKRRLKLQKEEGGDEEVELSLEDMEKGVMLERSYRQKTADLARQRESLQAKIREAVDPKLKELDDKLATAEQVIWHSLAPEIQNTDWNKLAAENPAEWAVKYQHVQNVNAKLAQIQAERKRLAEAAQEEMKGKLRKQAEESVEILKSEIPNWSNDYYGEILKSGVKFYGFKAEELNAITDHRAIKVLRDAMEYQALKAKPIVEKRTTPQAPKVVKPGAGEKDAGADKWKEGMAKLEKSGRKEDAVGLAMQLLARERKQK